MTPPNCPAPDPHENKAKADTVIAQCLRRLNALFPQSSVAAQCGDAPAQRADRDRRDLETGNVIAAKLRAASTDEPTSLLRRLWDCEPLPTEEDTEPVIKDDSDA